MLKQRSINSGGLLIVSGVAMKSPKIARDPLGRRIQVMRLFIGLRRLLSAPQGPHRHCREMQSLGIRWRGSENTRGNI